MSEVRSLQITEPGGRRLDVEWSGGGPLACAALLPDRIDAVATIASVAPRDAEGSIGSPGWFDDDVAYLGGWGFKLDAVGCPTTIRQGREDRFVPPAHGEWLAAHVPGARFAFRPDDGHLSQAVSAYGDVLDGLLHDDQTDNRT